MNNNCGELFGGKEDVGFKTTARAEFEEMNNFDNNN